MGQCTRVYVCVQRKQVFGVLEGLSGEVQKCQNGVVTFTSKMRSKSKVHKIAIGHYLEHLLLQNQNVWRSGHALPTSLTYVNNISEFDILGP